MNNTIKAQPQSLNEILKDLVRNLKFSHKDSWEGDLSKLQYTQEEHKAHEMGDTCKHGYYQGLPNELRIYSDSIYYFWKNSGLKVMEDNADDFFCNTISTFREFWKLYGKNEVREAILNYACVYRDPQYWPSFRCTVKRFLRWRCFTSFLPKNFKQNYYRRYK